MSHSFKKQHLKPWGLEIVNKYPLVFLENDDEILSFTKDTDPNDRVNLRYGFEHDQGWSKLIEELAGTATELVTHLRETEENSTAFIHGFICKEKFGGLRWQGNFSLPEPFVKLWYAYVAEIERRSLRTCEVTGQYGVLCKKNDGSWIRTLSEEKAKEMGYTPIEL